MQTKKQDFVHNPIFYVFLISFAYWIYLFLTSRMEILYDSIGYQNLGEIIYKKGWVQFFTTGPNREPLYPWTISISMSIGDLLKIPYQEIQKIIQIIFLFATQCLTYRLLTKLEISRTVKAIITLYIGLSPALINSTFSLYSEILTYPIILGIVFFSIVLWESIEDGSSSKILLIGCILSALFILITLVKAIFQAITPVFLIFFFFVVYFSIQDRQKILKKMFLCFFVIFSLCSTGITGYKLLNLKYNGHYVFTDRGPSALYGNTVRRMEPLNFKRFLSGLAYVAGENVCRNAFGEEEWVFWSFRTSDMYSDTKIKELKREGLNDSQVDSTLMDLTKKEVIKNPLQYILLTGVEGAKMFFWESTKIGFVSYPAWLNRLFDTALFKNGLRFLISLISILVFFYSMVSMRKTAKNPTVSIICVFILTYTFIHSFFFILTRYALPIAPLYLILTAFMLKRFSQKIKHP